MRICGYRDLTVEKEDMDEKLVERSRNLSKESEDELLEVIRSLLLSRENPRHTQELAASTHLPETDDTDLVAGTEDLNLSSQPSSISPTSIPAKNLSSANATPPSTPRTPITLTPSPPPLWRGCASFLCPEDRPIGDHRPRCTAAVRECTLCGVHVCPDCLLKDSPCDCSYCQENYRCPSCFRWLGQPSCRKVEEDEKARKRREAEEEKRRKAEEEMAKADGVAEIAGAFMDMAGLDV